MRVSLWVVPKTDRVSDGAYRIGPSMVRRCILFCLLVFLGAPLHAQTTETEERESRGVRHERHLRDEMHPDRPELTTSSRVVSPGRVQLEAEMVVEREKEAGESALVLPALLRVGVGDNVELRLESDLLKIEGEHAGLSDLNVGVKWNFLSGDPSLGILADVTFPAGNSKFTVNEPEPRILLLADFPLADRWELRLNAGAVSPVDNEERVIRGLFGVAIFTELTETLEAHAEWGRLSPNRVDDTDPIHVVDFGLALKLDRDTQCDLAFFKGLSGESLDWKVSLGFAKRF